MITVTYTSQKYSPERVKERLVKLVSGEFVWCEVGHNNLDVRQGKCGLEDLPENVVRAASAVSGKTFSYVNWPICNKG